MVAIEINFLTGRFVAASHHDRNTPEWPPHPARLFSALVATWADADRPDSAERQAIEWLESQRPPSISASEATPRAAVTHFVPVNDARIFAPTSYNNRASKVEDLLAQIGEARTHGTTKGKMRSLNSQLRKQRDVSQMVSKAGNTPVKSAVNLLPPGWISAANHVRTGQARVFPSVTPHEPLVTYIWDADPSPDMVSSIDRICARLTRLGHSSSLVSCRVTPDPPAANHFPGPGAVVMRSVRSGQLAALEREYRKHRASKPRALPFTSVRYRRVERIQAGRAARQPHTAGDWLVLSLQRKSRRFPSTLTVEIATALRGAVFRYATDPIPEGVSGHRPQGTPSQDPHVAFLPLPWVGHQHADGRLMGAAIAIPYSLDDQSRRALFRSIGSWEAATDGKLALTLGRRGRLEMRRIIGPTTLETLRQGPWSRKSRAWTSATPIALPTHPGPLSSGTAAARAKAWARAKQAVVNACHHIGLPEPVRIGLSLAPLIPGARPAPAFPSFRQPGRGGKPVARRLLHASVTFDQEVAGPVVLGAGRYLGLGLMRPMSDPGSK